VVATKLYLRNQGYYHAPKWGLSQFPDRALFDAIKAFQDSQGLRVDGVMKPNGETETAIKKHALARHLETKSIQGAAQKLQSLGRNGDTILAHITPAEAQLLNDVTDGGSLNPNTGLPEFFLGDFFSGMSNSFSSIGSNLSDSFSSFGDSFTSSLSEIGDSISNSFSDLSAADNPLSNLQDQQNQLDGLLSSDAAKAVENGFGSNMNTSLSDHVSNALTQTKTPQVSGLGGNIAGGSMADNLPSASEPLSASSGLKYSLNSTRTPVQQAQNVKAMQAQQSAIKLQFDRPINQTQSFGTGLFTDQQTRDKQRSQNMFNKIDQQGSKAFAAPAAQAVKQNIVLTPQIPQAQSRTKLAPAIASMPKSSPTLSPKAEASLNRTAAASAKTTDHTNLQRDAQYALDNGGAKGQAEVQHLTQGMNTLKPGSGDKLAEKVGLKTQTQPSLPLRKPETPLDKIFKDY